MKGIRIELEQTIASYCKPGSLQLKETYPLAPYSTIIGMIHNSCGFKKYIDMDVSVQGGFSSLCYDLFKRYEYSPNIKYEEPKPDKRRRHQGYFVNDGIKYGIVIGIGYVELLTDVTLLIHVVPKDQNMIDTLYHGIYYPKEFLSLGRSEDLVRINKVEAVDIFEETLERKTVLKNNAYIPLKYNVVNNIGTVYRLNKKYVITPKKTRYWEEQVEALYAPKDMELTIGTKVYKDSKGDLVFLA